MLQPDYELRQKKKRDRITPVLAVLHRLRLLQSKVIVLVFQALNGLGRNACVHILPQDSQGL